MEHLLGEQLSSTNYEQEYILTVEEEEVIIAHEISALRKKEAWKIGRRGFTAIEVEEKLKDVNWEERINRNEILRIANNNKHYRLWLEKKHEEEKLEEERKKEALRNEWTAKKMFHLMAYNSLEVEGKKLLVSDYNTHLIKTICFFLSNDERFETELKYSFTKGLLIRGIAGVGKTHLIKCVANNELNPILVLSMLEVAEEVKENGMFEVPDKKHTKLYLDDVGSEESTVNYYGTKINWLKNFIELFYLKNSKSFSRLIISTNNSFQQIEDRYGFRVRSRFKDMFNIIDVEGSDMRGTLFQKED